jgi:hypothetical protein
MVLLFYFPLKERVPTLLPEIRQTLSQTEPRVWNATYSILLY